MSQLHDYLPITGENITPYYIKYTAVGSSAPRYVVKQVIIKEKILPDTPYGQAHPEEFDQKLDEIRNLKRVATFACRSNILCFTEYYFQVNPKNQETYLLNLVTDAFVNSIPMNEFIQRRVRLPLKSVLKIFYQLVEGMHYIHTVGLAHNDIKPGNILINMSNYDVQIIDYGLACADLCSNVGTILYTAPELLMQYVINPMLIKSEITQKADVFSMGIVLYKLLYYKYPFILPDVTTLRGDERILANTLVTQYAQTGIARSEYRWGADAALESSINKLVNTMLRLNPEKRLNSERSLQILRGIVNRYNELVVDPDERIDMTRLILTKPPYPATFEPTKNELSPLVLQNKYYLLDPPLGKGTFGAAYLAVRIEEPKFIIKQFTPLPTADSLGRIEFELANLKRIREFGCKPNLECFTEYFIDRQSNAMSFNIVTNTLDDYNNVTTISGFIGLVKNLAPLHYSTVIKIFDQCVDALLHLHTIGVAHLNINWSNIMIHINNFNIQFVNFEPLCRQNCEYHFSSPELLNWYNSGAVEQPRNTTWNWNTQVFSLGMVFYYLLHYKHPIEEDTNRLYQLESGSSLLLAFYNSKEYIQSTYNVIGGENTEIEGTINDLVSSMLIIDPEGRIYPDSLQYEMSRLKLSLNRQNEPSGAMILSSPPQTVLPTQETEPLSRTLF